MAQGGKHPVRSWLRGSVQPWLWLLLLLWATASLPAWAESCSSAADMDTATKAALEQAGRRYLQMAANQDFAGLKQSSIPLLASSFAGIEAAVVGNHPNLEGAQATLRAVFLLEAPGTTTYQRAEFFCGIYNSPERVTFVLSSLPAGHYGVVIEDLKGGQAPLSLLLVLNQQAGAWKLAGMYLAPTRLAGHDAQWFWDQARAFKASAQKHNAWLYYLAAWDLLAPADFMYTVPRERLSEEMEQIRPAEMPAPAKPMPLVVGARTYRITQMLPEPVGTELFLGVTYQVPDLSNPLQVAQDNTAVMRTLVAQYPELRQAFSGVVARAVDPSGRDYGSLLAMKDIE
jgi:hypothetical protein